MAHVRQLPASIATTRTGLARAQTLCKRARASTEASAVRASPGVIACVQGRKSPCCSASAFFVVFPLFFFLQRRSIKHLCESMHAIMPAQYANRMVLSVGPTPGYGSETIESSACSVQTYLPLPLLSWLSRFFLLLRASSFFFPSLVSHFTGESAVGKSSLVLRFVKGQFHEYQESTIGGKCTADLAASAPF